jgi:hypothetical protein
MTSLNVLLQNVTELHIRQRRELAELIGFETRNKFEIKTAEGAQVGFAAEERKGFFDFLFRQFLGHWRRFDILIFDETRRPVFRAKHPFRWIFQRMEIFNEQDQCLGALQQRFALFSKSFDVQDAQGQVVLSVRSPIWRIWTFPFLTAQGQEQARVEKRWSGLLREAFTDQDFFVLKLDPSAPAALRPLLLASAIFIDLQYFEKKAR